MSATAARPPAARAAAIAGPAGTPLLGMAGALRRDPLGTLEAGFARYGDVVAFRVGPAHGPRRLRRTVVALRHPDDVRRVLADAAAFTRETTSFAVLRELFGINLVTAQGERWRRQKRLLQPLFTRAAAARYAPLVAAEAHALAERLAAEPAGAIDALRTAERYALRVLGRTLFADERGVEAETIAALERLVPAIGTQLVARSRQPLRPPLAWPTPRNRRFVETRDALRATIARVIARRQRRGAEAGEDQGEDLLSRLRDARDPDGGRPLSTEEIRDQALIFLIAGHTTTANALCATLHLLGRHPQVQERVADGGEPLARAAVQEALRLYPPAYLLGRRVGPGGAEIRGHALAPGTDVLVSPWITHRHPGFWSDPERFDPWRFAGERARPPEAWLAFGSGPRACIGRHLALLESAALVAALLARCRIAALDASYPTAQLTSMRPSRPVWIACTPR